MTDLADVYVDMKLTYHEARMVRTALKAKRAKFELNRRKPFTPAPGEIDKNVAGIMLIDIIATRLDKQLDQAIEGVKHGHDQG